MTLVDDRILEYLRENETGSPTEMKNEGPMNYSSPYIGRRAKRLAEEGLTRHLGNAVYTITDDGEAYLDGRLDTQEWRYIDDDADDVSIDGAADDRESGSATNGGPM